MAWWTAPLIYKASEMGGELLNRWLGRDRISPELSRLIERIEAMYEGGLPEGEIARISAPYVRLKKNIEQSYARQKGASGLKHTIIKRQATTPQAEAIGGAQTRFRTGLLDILGQLQMGAEPYRQRGTDWGQLLGGVGGAFGQAYAEEDEFKQLMELLGSIMGEG